MNEDRKRYSWLLANMGAVEGRAREWRYPKDKPLMIYLDEFVEAKVAEEPDTWFDLQHAVLEHKVVQN